MYEDLKTLQHKAHEMALEKGWYERSRELPELIALAHSELSEALEDWRNGHSENFVFHEHADIHDKPRGVPIELADCVIRILDICEHFGIDLQSAIDEKMRYNATRPIRHGGKRA